MKIKVLRLNKSIQLPKVISKGDWIDLRLSHAAALKAPYAETLKRKKNDNDVNRIRTVIFDYQLLSLGVAIQLPKGFEAVVVPRSSLFNKYGVIQTDSFGVIDNTYCGNNDEWKFPALPTRNITIPADERICQFRI